LNFAGEKYSTDLISSTAVSIFWHGDENRLVDISDSQLVTLLKVVFVAHLDEFVALPLFECSCKKSEKMVTNQISNDDAKIQDRE
jgi:hypothetical protein